MNVVLEPARKIDTGRQLGETLEAIRRRCTEQVDARQLYEELEAVGFSYGKQFRGVEQIWRRAGEALGLVAVPPGLDRVAQYIAHPSVLDACLHVMSGTMAQRSDLQNGRSYITYIRSFRQFRPLGSNSKLWSHAKLTNESLGSTGGLLEGDVNVLDADGELLAQLRGLCVQYLPEPPDESRPDSGIAKYSLSWFQASERPIVEDERALQGLDLVFMDEGGFGESVRAALIKRGRLCRVVRLGSEFAADPNGDYRLDRGQASDFERVLREVVAAAVPVARVIILSCALGANSEDLSGGASLEAVTRASQPVFFALQAFAKLGHLAPAQLHVVTANTQAVLDDSDVVNAHSASIWGIIRSARYEIPSVRCRLIDLDGMSARHADTLADSLTTLGFEEEVALREGDWYLGRLTRVNEAADGGRPGHPLRADRCYLITGGLGAVGLHVAQGLVDRGARFLMLMGRHEPSLAAAQVIAQLQSTGAHVAVERVDVTDIDALRDSILRAPAPLGGVIHAAGVLDDGALTQLPWERFYPVLAPKVAGAVNLYRATERLELDFFVLFSSTASLLGSPGQTNYAAANSFMDAFARVGVAHGRKVLSIHWGAFAEAGMAAALSEIYRQRMTERGIRLIEPAAGIGLMCKMFDRTVGAVAVLSVEWGAFLTWLHSARGPSSVFEVVGQDVHARASAGTESSEDLAGKLRLCSSAADSAVIVADFVRRLAARILRVNDSELPQDQSLNALGLDSIMTVEFNRGIRTQTAVEIPVERYFEGLTLTDVTHIVAGELWKARSEVSGAAQ